MTLVDWREKPMRLPLHLEMLCIVFGSLEWLIIKIGDMK